MARPLALSMLAALLGITSAWAVPVGTSFSYQGELRFNGLPASGTYDFEFALFNVEAAGIPLSIDTVDDQLVTAGLFTAAIDYTDVPFAASEEYWLEVRVRDGTSVGGYQQLLPRQKVTPAPYAINSRGVQAGGVDSAALADNAVVSGKIAANAVASLQIVDGSVAGADVDQAQVQRRVTGTCAPGSAVQGVDANGAVTCQAAGTGSVTNIATAGGLTGGPVTVSGTLSIADDGVTSAKIQDGGVALADLGPNSVDSNRIVNASIVAADVDTASIQRRVTGNCTGAVRQVNADGTTSCNNAVGLPRPLLLSIPQVVTVSGVGASSVTIGIDGLPLASFYAPGTGDLVMVHCENIACTNFTATSIDTAGDVGDHNSILIGRSGFGVVSYYDATNRDLKVAACLDVACTTANLVTVDSVGDVGLFTSIGSGSNGLVVAYHDDGAGDLKIALCDNTCATSTLVTLDPAANEVGVRNAVLVLRAFVVVAHHDATAGTLKLARCRRSGSTCFTSSSVTIDATPTSGAGIALTRMDDLIPVIFYTRPSEVRAIRCSDVGCEGALSASNAIFSGVQPTLISATLDALGYPMLVMISVPSGTINTIRCNDRQCSGAGLSGFFVGAGGPGFNAQPAITLGQHGFPVVTSRNGNTGGVAWICDNVLCDFTGRER